MAIAINGSGTITGISAGGLPDGVITRPDMGYAGAILQVVNATYSTQVTNNTTTYSDTGLTATITPTSSANKILVLVNQAGMYKSNGNVANGVWARLLRGSTTISTFAVTQGYTNTAIENYAGCASTCYLDSPATTSALTYKTQFRNQVAANLVYVQVDSTESTITLLEVAV